MSILITGGAGYIGGHCVQHFLDSGRQDVVVFDNLSTGHRELLPAVPFVHGNLQDTGLLIQTMRDYQVQSVMHFAAAIAVGESVSDPGKYYDTNVCGTLSLLQAMRASGVRKLLFSSSCAVYGTPQRLPLDENHPMAPVSPYGFTKRAVEEMLQDFSRAYGLNYVSLRYFNAAGADPHGRMGEWHDPETHLIPLVLRAISGKLPFVALYGTDYPTPDGTAIRDYIHIMDLAEAHRLGLSYLDANGPSDAFNVGTETGHSVREVIAACERVTGRQAPVVHMPRRAGDAPVLVASAAKLRARLQWTPHYASLDDIIASAWRWEEALEAAPHRILVSSST